MTTHSVTAGETSTGITLSNGDFLYVSSGGTTSFITVSNGGTEAVSSGGSAVSTTLTGADATLLVYAGGTATSTEASLGAIVSMSGGTASFTTLSRFGIDDVDANGMTISNVVSSEAVENVYAGGTADFTQVRRGGTENAYSDGTADFTVLSSGGAEMVYSSGAAAGVAVQGGGTLFVLSGGTAYLTTVRSGAAEFVYSGATVISPSLHPGALLVVLPGGTPTGIVGFGGHGISTGIVLYQPQSGTTALGASATDIAVTSGAIEFVLPSGTTSFTTLSSGGTEDVFANGTAVSTTVRSGSAEFVYSGADPIGTTVNVGGSIDVSDLAYASNGSASVNSSDLLTVSVGGQLYVQQLAGGYADVHFQVAQDARSGTLVTAEAGAQCFRSFTRILTDRGEIAVEDLHVGDLVRTVLRETLTPIAWIGRRHVDCARHPQPRKVWPVRIAAGAFGPGRPGKELFLSPDHAVYVNSVLIPIKHLINGGTIVQVPVDDVTYYHLELLQHGVLLAEGLPTESFLDLRDGSNYANRPGPCRLYPDFSARMWEAFGCARLIVTGSELAAARALVARFATRQEAA
jgi:autotransporter passenger strand-loop-strand repeat protein